MQKSFDLDQDFALLSAFHDSEESLELAREELLNSVSFPSNKESKFLRLKLIWLQQKLGRLTEIDGGNQIPPKLWDLHQSLLQEVRGREFHTRALLLEASVIPEKRQKLFEDVTNGGFQDPHHQQQQQQPLQSVGHCNQGHSLTPFQTPTPNFTCDCCGTRMPQDVPMYGCRPCDFDVCSSCFSGNDLVSFAVRPQLDFESVVKEVLTNVSKDRSNVFQRLTEHSLGIVFSLTASGLFDANAASFLSKNCAEIFSPVSLKGRLNLRALCTSMTAQSTLISLSQFPNEECVLKLIVSDLQSGTLQEDRDHDLLPMMSQFHSYSFLPSLSSFHLQRMGELEPRLFLEEWYALALLMRALPSADELDENNVSVENQWVVLERSKAIADVFRAHKPAMVESLDFLLLHYRVKLDRKRRQPLLPNSLSLPQRLPSTPLLESTEATVGSEQTNLKLLMDYLHVCARPGLSKPQHFGSAQKQHDQDILCQSLHRFLPTPSLDQDVDLISKEMRDLFVWKQVTESTFASVLETKFVHQVYVESTVSAPTPRLQFCDFNATSFSASCTSIELSVEVSNIKSLTCKVFEIDACRLLRQTQKEIASNINLDGLVPQANFSVPLSDDGYCQRERITVLEGKSLVGCYVIEFVGDGLAIRCVVEVGMIRCKMVNHSFGHVFFPFELDPLPIALTDKVELFVGDKVYVKKPGDEGIVVPFSSEWEETRTAVLTCGKRSHVFSFQLQRKEIQVRAEFAFDREALCSGNQSAQVLVTPVVTVSGVQAPLQLLSEWKFTLSFLDAFGIVSEQVFMLDFAHRFQEEVVFKVIPNLRAISGRLVAMSRKQEVVECNNVLEVSVNASTDKRVVCMRPLEGNRFELLVMGRSGEALENEPVTVLFTHEATTLPIKWECRSSSEGRVELGDLSQCTLVTVLYGGGNRRCAFPVPRATVKRNTTNAVALASESDAVQFIFPLAKPRSQLTGKEFALVELDCMRHAKRHLFASHLSLSSQGTHVYVSNLRPGNYLFHYFSPHETFHVEIQVCATVNDGKLLRLPVSSRNPCRLFAVNTNPTWSQRHAVTVGSLSMLKDNVVALQVSGGSTKGRRVSVTMRTFCVREEDVVPSSLELISEQTQLSEWFHPTRVQFVPQRKLDEEIVYCMNRQQILKRAGNLLPVPSLLINPFDLGISETKVQNAKEGTKHWGANSLSQIKCQKGGDFGANFAQMCAAAPPYVIPAVLNTPCLDFLSAPSVTFANLIPEEDTGNVYFETSPGCTWIEVTVTDGEDPLVQAKSFLLLPSESRPVFLDLRHSLKDLRLTDHLVERQVSVVAKPGEKFEIGNLSTARFAVLDTFSSCFQFVKAVLPNEESRKQLESFSSFLCDWHVWKSDEEKLAAYTKVASPCHELHWFLKHRDVDFFNRYIRVQLEAKVELELLERILLEDESLVEYSMNMKLTLLEIAFLAIHLKTRNPSASACLLRQLRDAAKRYPEEVETARSILFQTAMQMTSGSAMAGGVPPPMEGDGIATMSDMSTSSMEASFGGRGGGARPQLMMMKSRQAEQSNRMERMMANIQNEQEEEKDTRQEDLVNRIHEVETQAEKERFKETGPAHKWCETQYVNKYLHPLCSPENATFWFAFASFHLVDTKTTSEKFACPDLCLSRNTSVSEALFMLAVLDAPFELPKEHVYQVRRLQGELDFFPSVPCVVFHQQLIQPPVAANEEAPVTTKESSLLLGQRLFEAEDFQTREKEPLEVVKGREYISRTVVTNVSSQLVRVKLLVQIPEGSLPLDGQQASQSVSLVISAFSTVTHISPRFYFPFAGRFPWFPAHVSQGGLLMAFASGRELQVQEAMSVLDETSWRHISSPSATIEQVEQYLDAHDEFSIRDLHWRFTLKRAESKSDWQRICAVLEKRGIFSPDLLAFGLLFQDTKRSQDCLESKFASQVGPSFHCLLWSRRRQPSASKRMQELVPEVFPLVNARAHELGNVSSRSCNEEVNSSFQRLMETLIFNTQPMDDTMRLHVAIKCLERNQLDLAQQIAQTMKHGKRTMQSDYLSIYLSFFVQEGHAMSQQVLQANLDLANQYITFPNKFWRERFAKVVASCSTLLMVGGGSQQQQAMVAHQPVVAAQARLPSFEIECREDDSLLHIQTLHMDAQAEFKVSIFQTDVEHLFSTKPFSMLDGAAAVSSTSNKLFTFPNFVTFAKLTNVESQLLTVPLPASVVRNRNVLIQVEFQNQQRVVSKFTCAMKVVFMEQAGLLRCMAKDTFQPIAVAYCKVYAKSVQGAISFYKDGYTDVCGEFDYCALNTGRLSQVEEFAILVLHPDFGSVLQRVRKPHLS